MGKIFNKQQLKEIIKEYNLKEGKDVVGAVKDLMKELLQEMLDEELELELGYSKHDYKNKKTDNRRNGTSKKTVRSTLAACVFNPLNFHQIYLQERKNEIIFTSSTRSILLTYQMMTWLILNCIRLQVLNSS